MLKKIVSIFGGDPNQKRINELAEMAAEINALEPVFEQLSDAELRAKTDEFRAKIQAAVKGFEIASDEYLEVEQEILGEIMYEAFAVVREASKRTLGMRHYDVQLIGGITIHRGEVAEMRTGEGKTLVGTLPVYLNALTGRGVHLITVNDYLARRDPRWMGPIYHFLGLSVGILQSASSTENGKKAFLYDPEKESTQEDQHQLKLVDRKLAYAADITYGTNSEFGFDYLRDNMAMSLERRVQRGHYFAIIDEVDNVLIDEARTPLIISGPSNGDMGDYTRMATIARQLRAEDYEINERDRSIALTEIGIAHVEELLGEPLSDPERPEDVTPEQARLLGYLEQALRAEYLFKRNKDYLVQGGKVIIVDEHTGRLMAGRRWSDGLHQAVEAKEGVKIEPENITYATVTLQNYFRMYNKLAGMTGTALTEAEEFDKIYSLEVLPIPTNLEYQAANEAYRIEARTAKEADTGYEYTYYVPEGAPADYEPELWKRKDYPDSIYRTVEAKLRAIVQEAAYFYVLGRPQLIGTTSVESSDRLSGRLHAEPVRRLLQTLLIRRRWMEANDREEDGRAINELKPIYIPLEELSPTQLREFAKPLGMSINPADPENLQTLLYVLNLGEKDLPRLELLIKGGIPHNVLNARKHTEESQIIAGAGAFGAVTIATNMAGRGVDIKLGGDIAEEILATVNRVLGKNNIENYYNLNLNEQRQLLLERGAELDYGIYEAEIQLFLQYFEDMEHVRAVGGLHVIGSERHDARRIDNQLRGRAGRQGDPGSSRFFLSLEDDLMRLFGGEQVNNLMLRLNVDDTMPLEARIVSNIIEGSQQRVEGANFDVREHLLDYDNVLNAQRERIYSQRDRVFVKEDLSEDVNDMLRMEVENRVQVALADEEEGPWRLLAWAEGVQPSFTDRDDELFPSFTLQLLLDKLDDDSEPEKAIIDLIREAIDAEQSHLFKAITNLVERTGENFESQLQERFDALDTFIQASGDYEEKRSAQEMLNELNNLLHLPLKLSNNELRHLADDPYEIEDELREKVEDLLKKTALARMIGTIELRLQESLDLNIAELLEMEWADAEQAIIDAADEALETRLDSLAGEDGQLAKDLASALKREPVEDWSDTDKARLLIGLSQGVRSGFDRRTHKQVKQTFARFNYSYLAAQSLVGREAEELTAEVMDHFDDAQAALQDAWGDSLWREKMNTAATLAEFGPAAATLGDDYAQTAPRDLPEEQRDTLIDALGHHRLNNIQRDLLLRAITDQWVEYLTKVEALRVSIGLEAYAQRDPLVQYRRQASEMFQQLMSDIRSQVVSRVFAYQPRRWNADPLGTMQMAVSGSVTSKTKEAKKKKKRKRH
jgi:preprotein translocase subunit SecA